MRYSKLASLAAVIALLLTSCGNDGPRPGQSLDTIPPIGGGAGGGSTVGVDVCTLLPGEEIVAALGLSGTIPASVATEPAGPFTGCNWGQGWLIIQIAESERIIVPPSDPCPVTTIGDESRSCDGRIGFYVNGIHTTVSTLDPHPVEALETVARALVPVIEAL